VIVRDEEGTFLGRGESGPGGGFAILAPAGRACAVRAADGAGRVARAAAAVAGGAPVDLVLGPPGERTLRVLVLDAAGRPVAGVLLAGPAAADGSLPATDRRGRATLRDLPAEELVLALLPAAAGRGALPAGSAPPVPLRVLPAGQEVVLACRPGRECAGTVREAGGGPAAGATVRLVLADGSSAAAAADAEGRWTAWLPAGVAVLRGGARAAGPAGPGVAAAVGAEAFEAGEPVLVLPAAPLPAAPR
jgi:hypothetical protein